MKCPICDKEMSHRISTTMDYQSYICDYKHYSWVYDYGKVSEFVCGIEYAWRNSNGRINRFLENLAKHHINIARYFWKMKNRNK
jgi:hypothetical protein